MEREVFSMYAAVNGTRIYYEIIGKGRPLLMVHGNGEDHKIFDVAAGKLRERYKVYLVDLRGHGKSDPVSEYHYGDMAEDLNAFMRMLNMTDVIYYGYSDGGIVGLLLTMKTDRITRLIISGANLKFKGLNRRCRFMIASRYLFTRDPKLKMMMKEPDIDAIDLSQIKAKTTVITGERDLVLYEESKRIADAIPLATLRIIKGEGHGSYIVHSEKIADILIDELYG